MKTDGKHTSIPGERKPFSDIPDFDDGILLLPDLGMDFAKAEKAVMCAPDTSGSGRKAGRVHGRDSLVRAINITPPSSYADVAVKLRVVAGITGMVEEHMVSLRQALDFVAVDNDTVFAWEIYAAAARKLMRQQPLSPAVTAGLDAVSDCYAPGVDLDAYLAAIDAGQSHRDALADAGGAGR